MYLASAGCMVDFFSWRMPVVCDDDVCYIMRMSVYTDQISFSTSDCSNIGNTGSHMYISGGTCLSIDASNIHLKAEHLYLRSRNSIDPASLSAESYLNDAEGNVLIEKGVWKFGGGEGSEHEDSLVRFNDNHSLLVGPSDVEAKGQWAVVIGSCTSAADSAVAIGSYTFAHECATVIGVSAGTEAAQGTKANVVVGSQARASAEGSIAIGSQSATSCGAGIALGYRSVSRQAISLGHLAKACLSGLALGCSSYATESAISIGSASYSKGGSIVIGKNSLADYDNTIVIGANSSATCGSSVVLGSCASAKTGTPVVIGYKASACGSGVSIGTQSISRHNGISIGKSTVASFYSIAIGDMVSAPCIGSFVLGTGASIPAAGEGVLRVFPTYGSSTATELKLVGAGSKISKSQLDGEAGLGYMQEGEAYKYIKLSDLFDTTEFDDTGHILGGTASAADSVAIGVSSKTDDHDSLAAGAEAQALGGFATAVGSKSSATYGNSTALGYAAKSSDNSIALGYSSLAPCAYSITIGANTTIKRRHSIAIGANTRTCASYSTVIGNGANATAELATVVGYKATVDACVGSFAFGAFAKTSDHCTGVFRVSAGRDEQEDDATELKLVGHRSKTSETYLDGEAGLGYKQGTNAYKYIKLSTLFNPPTTTPGTDSDSSVDVDAIKAEAIAAATQVASEAVDNALESKSIVIGAASDSNANIVSIELDGSHFDELKVNSISLLGRQQVSAGVPSDTPLWLSIWKQNGADDYTLMAVSKEAVAQRVNDWSSWSFDGVQLDDSRIRIAAIATPETQFSDASELGIRVQQHDVDDSCLIHTPMNPIKYHPTMIIGGGAPYAPSSHVGDDTHLAAGEREKWNGAAYEISSHRTDSDIHVTMEDKERWDKAANGSGSGNVEGGFDDTGNITGGTTSKDGDTAVGIKSVANYGDSTAIGYNAKSTACGSLAIGVSSEASAGSTTAIGSYAKATYDFSTAIGYAAEACGSYDTLVGTFSSTTSNLVTAIGYDTEVTGHGSFAVGVGAKIKTAGEGVWRVTVSNSFEANDVQATELKLIGYGSKVSTSDLDGEAGLGYKQGNGEYKYIKLSTLFSPQTSSGNTGFEDTGKITGGIASDYDAIAIGNGSTASSGVAIGAYTSATSCGSIALGIRADSTSYSTVIGSSARAANKSIAIGYGAAAADQKSIALGNDATAGDRSTVIGYGASASESGSFAVGYLAKADNSGEGVWRVAVAYMNETDTATELKLIARTSPISTAQLDSEAGLGYKVGTSDYRYVKLKALFDLAERAEEILSLLDQK